MGLPQGGGASKGRRTGWAAPSKPDWSVAFVPALTGRSTRRSAATTSSKERRHPPLRKQGFGRVAQCIWRRVRACAVQPPTARGGASEGGVAGGAIVDANRTAHRRAARLQLAEPGAERLLERAIARVCPVLVRLLHHPGFLLHHFAARVAVQYHRDDAAVARFCEPSCRAGGSLGSARFPSCPEPVTRGGAHTGRLELGGRPHRHTCPSCAHAQEGSAERRWMLIATAPLRHGSSGLPTQVPAAPCRRPYLPSPLCSPPRI